MANSKRPKGILVFNSERGSYVKTQHGELSNKPDKFIGKNDKHVKKHSAALVKELKAVELSVEDSQPIEKVTEVEYEEIEELGEQKILK